MPNRYIAHAFMHLPSHPEDDPRPLPPERPNDEDCCQSGCSPCIFDLYSEEMDRWRAALKAWEAREAARRPPRR
ncbi:oxidoreductase-like domain-containing protein [Paraburkholderia sacchari]|uniref:oxidoreductase-like domain-containing protein n=1 Tax=Paraburkholderia sacchari TaxID=159450 RepID=UPI000A61CCA7